MNKCAKHDFIAGLQDLTNCHLLAYGQCLFLAFHTGATDIGIGIYIIG